MVGGGNFEEPAWSGQVILATNDQVVLLHGDLLARHDIKTAKEVWSRHLVDKKAIAAEDFEKAARLRDRIKTLMRQD